MNSMAYIAHSAPVCIIPLDYKPLHDYKSSFKECNLSRTLTSAADNKGLFPRNVVSEEFLSR